MVSVICEPLPKLKESWEEKVGNEEKVIEKLSQPPSENTVVEQSLTEGMRVSFPSKVDLILSKDKE